jgi:predicted kinase
VPFDCIEFDARIRMIDVMSDVAFTVMDLQRHDLPRLAARYLDGYLQRTGDYAGLGVLRFYCVYRAMVRAKIACLRAHQADLGERERPVAFESVRRHLALALRLSRRAPGGLVLMHGLSGSGKTTVAAELLEILGAIRLRSDVERKRLHGLAPLASSGSAPGGGIYGHADTEGTYERLVTLARGVLAEGFPVIVDATFLRRAQREPFRALAAEAGVAFSIVVCEAPESTLRERLAIRARGPGDASEADAAVLALQIAQREPLDESEVAAALAVDTTREGSIREAGDALLRRL